MKKLWTNGSAVLLAALMILWVGCAVQAQDDLTEPEVRDLRSLQFQAIDGGHAEWAHWGIKPDKYSGWTNHSNRLIPVYCFGMSLDSIQGTNSVYRDEKRLEQVYRRMPQQTLNPDAEYFDQTDLYQLQLQAVAAGKKNIILIIFDGMDWQTTQAAAIYRNQAVTYTNGRGNGLAFQDYDRVPTDYGFMVTSPCNNSTDVDVNTQTVSNTDRPLFGGYNPQLGGAFPWSEPASYAYLISQDGSWSHAFTDSASSATSMTSGIKTFNSAINVAPDGEFTEPIARQLQHQGFSVGIVSSVPISHATPAAGYANNVSRNDYQDLSRDLLGLPSIAHRTPLPGVDVLLGCGWGKEKTTETEVKSEIARQGNNFVPGNRYLAKLDLDKVDTRNGGKYVVVARTAGSDGKDLLAAAAARAASSHQRLLGFFGGVADHLPYATADGKFDPTRGASQMDVYQPADLVENPTLADLTAAALQVLEQNESGFWLMIEPGDVDWANHENNIDNAIGAVFSGDAAFREVCRWAESRDCWDETAIIVTADHGHLLVLDRPEMIIPRPLAAGPAGAAN